jgi:hypothetical protein
VCSLQSITLQPGTEARSGSRHSQSNGPCDLVFVEMTQNVASAALVWMIHPSQARDAQAQQQIDERIY